MTLPKLQFEQRYFLTEDGTKIGYQVFGNPHGQPVLLANGLGGSYLAYCFLIDNFKDRFRFYCWDYRGVYSSGEPARGDETLSIAHHAADGVALIEHEKLEKYSLSDGPWVFKFWSKCVATMGTSFIILSCIMAWQGKRSIL